LYKKGEKSSKVRKYIDNTDDSNIFLRLKISL